MALRCCLLTLLVAGRVDVDLQTSRSHFYELNVAYLLYHERGACRLLDAAVLLLNVRISSEHSFSTCEKQVKLATQLLQFLLSLSLPEGSSFLKTFVPSLLNFIRTLMDTFSVECQYYASPAAASATATGSSSSNSNTTARWITPSVLKSALILVARVKYPHFADNVKAILASSILMIVADHTGKLAPLLGPNTTANANAAATAAPAWFAAVQPLFMFALTTFVRLLETSPASDASATTAPPSATTTTTTASVLSLSTSLPGKVVYQLGAKQLDCLSPLTRRAIAELLFVPPVIESLYWLLVNGYLQVLSSLSLSLSLTDNVLTLSLSRSRSL